MDAQSEPCAGLDKPPVGERLGEDRQAVAAPLGQGAISVHDQ